MIDKDSYFRQATDAMKNAGCSVALAPLVVEGYRQRGLEPEECACLIAYLADFYENDEDNTAPDALGRLLYERLTGQDGQCKPIRLPYQSYTDYSPWEDLNQKTQETFIHAALAVRQA